MEDKIPSFLFDNVPNDSGHDKFGKYYLTPDIYIFLIYVSASAAGGDFYTVELYDTNRSTTKAIEYVHVFKTVTDITTDRIMKKIADAAASLVNAHVKRIAQALADGHAELATLLSHVKG
jgi:hypothetical protein